MQRRERNRTRAINTQNGYKLVVWIEFEGKDLQSNDITLEGVEWSYCFLLGGSVGVLICNEASSSEAIFFRHVLY
jgi:hypothetical protein